MDTEKVGKLIKQIRIDNHLTQKDLAFKYNITCQAVSKWENGKNIPDISLLKEICKDFKIDLSAFLEGNYISNKVIEEEKPKGSKNLRKFFIIGFLLVGIIVIISLFLNLNKDNDFEFKTISSNCSNFTISGSVAYNDIKSAIYIASINYCGGTDNNLYQSIDCILYEKNGTLENKISEVVIRNEKKEKLQELLKNVSFNIDNYIHKCREFQNHELYVSIKAILENGEVTNYKVPLTMNSVCDDN